MDGSSFSHPVVWIRGEHHTEGGRITKLMNDGEGLNPATALVYNDGAREEKELRRDLSLGKGRSEKRGEKDEEEGESAEEGEESWKGAQNGGGSSVLRCPP